MKGRTRWYENCAPRVFLIEGSADIHIARRMALSKVAPRLHHYTLHEGTKQSVATQVPVDYVDCKQNNLKLPLSMRCGSKCESYISTVLLPWCPSWCNSQKRKKQETCKVSSKGEFCANSDFHGITMCCNHATRPWGLNELLLAKSSAPSMCWHKHRMPQPCASGIKYSQKNSSKKYQNDVTHLLLKKRHKTSVSHESNRMKPALEL